MFDATYSAGLGGPVRRIRTPHKNDVLSGRGGSINSHRGNIQFREWVAKRKNDYNLAPSKQDKARVAREVIALVQNQSPPGRFLQKDQTASHGAMSWWVEIDDDRIMSKTSQALREGAPEIRKKHQVEKPVHRHAIVAASVPLGKRAVPTPAIRYSAQSTRPAVQVAVSNPITAYEESLLAQSQHSKSDIISQPAQPTQPTQEFTTNSHLSGQARFEPSGGEDYEQPTKRVRLNYDGTVGSPTVSTPPLTSIPTPTTEIEPLPENIAGLPEEVRNHTLALPDLTVGDITNEDFVNPFENELDLVSDFFFSPRPGVIRDSSLGGESIGSGSKWTSTSEPKIPPAPSLSGVRFNKNAHSAITNTMSKSGRYDRGIVELSAINPALSHANVKEGMAHSLHHWWEDEHVFQ